MIKMIYTPPEDMPAHLKILWRTKKPAKTLIETSEAMGMKRQYFGRLCNAYSLCTVESVLKIAAFFDIHPKEIDSNFPAWATHSRGANAIITTPMNNYEFSTETLARVKQTWVVYKEQTGSTLETTAPLLGLATTTFAEYLSGKNKLNAEFIIKFSSLTSKHPRDFAPDFPAFFLTK